MNARTDIPLCVDMDGTLLRTDTLDESLLALLKQDPFSLLRLPHWLLRGRAVLKQQLAQRTHIDAQTLPRHEAVVDWLRQQKAAGRRLILVTGADRRIAEAVAATQGDLFERVIASDGVVNLTGAEKRKALVREFGERGYDYAGNSPADLEVWSAARHAIVVGNAALRAQAAQRCPVECSFDVERASAAVWLKGLRLHQWIKNLLLFVPALLGHRFDSAGEGIGLLIAFLSFGLCASSVYVLNDLLDLAADRVHARKRRRPFASGRIGLRAGVIVSSLLLIGSFAVALLLPPQFFAVLAFYYVCTLGYSLALKRMPVVDVLMLAGLYTLRLIAGSAASGVSLSFWLLAFSMFLFLSLAIVKRYAEFAQLRESGAESAAGRGYHIDDLPLLRNLGVSSGYGAVLVLALYVNSPASLALYAHPNRLWLLCPLLLYWIMRVWMKTHRGFMHDDPIVFALRDRVSYAVGAMMAFVVYTAS